MRREQRITIARDGRDKGKTFLVTEMDAFRSERWAARALLALANAGAELPTGALDAPSMAALAAGFRGFAVLAIRLLKSLRYDSIADLLDEMMECVQYAPPGGLPAQKLFPGVNCQIEEVMTIADLRMVILELHLGFSLAAALSNSDEPQQASPAS